MGFPAKTEFTGLAKPTHETIMADVVGWPSWRHAVGLWGSVGVLKQLQRQEIQVLVGTTGWLRPVGHLPAKGMCNCVPHDAGQEISDHYVPRAHWRCCRLCESGNTIVMSHFMMSCRSCHVAIKRESKYPQGLGGGFQIFTFTPTWGNDPIWLIFLKLVETPTEGVILKIGRNQWKVLVFLGHGFCQIHSTKWEMGFLTIHFLNRIYHYWIFHGNLGVPP